MDKLVNVTALIFKLQCIIVQPNRTLAIEHLLVDHCEQLLLREAHGSPPGIFPRMLLFDCNISRSAKGPAFVPRSGLDNSPWRKLLDVTDGRRGTI